jgi:hypothetical protein
MLDFLKFYFVQNLRQINALGIEFDKTINVLTGGVFGETVSLRAAKGAGWTINGQTGYREPGWCLFCWFLGTFVQKNHCGLQFATGPSNWMTWVRAGLAFSAGLVGLYFFERWVLRLLLAHPEAGLSILVGLGLLAFGTTLAVEQIRKDLK